LDVLLGSRLIDPSRLIGDLTLRAPQRWWRKTVDRLAGLARKLIDGSSRRGSLALLALDWAGANDELLIGRHPNCDVVLRGPAVSRHHARLTFRDGTWVLQDLDSTNGTTLNGARVGRCQLRPGDELVLADERVLVD
jgi:hypothetical protein